MEILNTTFNIKFVFDISITGFLFFFINFNKEGKKII